MPIMLPIFPEMVVVRAARIRPPGMLRGRNEDVEVNELSAAGCHARVLPRNTTVHGLWQSPTRPAREIGRGGAPGAHDHITEQVAHSDPTRENPRARAV